MQDAGVTQAEQNPLNNNTIAVTNHDFDDNFMIHTP
jgi:hypothetical protein